MGYFLAAFLLLAVLVIAVFFLRGTPSRRGQLPSDHSLERAEPAADEPTPGASSTADPNSIAQAQKRTPPS